VTPAPVKSTAPPPVKSTGNQGKNLPANHCIEHLELNACVADATHTQIQQAKKKAEKELASWFAEGLLDEQEAHETWMVITDLLDGFAIREWMFGRRAKQQ
jgi:hypothetical protein